MQKSGLNFWNQHIAHGLVGQFISAVQKEKFISAIILVLLGLLLLFSAQRIYRWIIAVDVIAMGWVLAMMVADRSLLAAVAVVAVAVIAAIAVVPMLEIAFALVGAVAGCLIGIAVSHWMRSPPGTELLAAIGGLIAFGVIAFFVFRAALIFAFTLQGSAMFIGGSLVLLRHYGPASWYHWSLKTPLLQPTGLSLLTLGIACVGILVQQWPRAGKGEVRKG